MSILGTSGVAAEDDYVAMPKPLLLSFRATYFREASFSFMKRENCAFLGNSSEKPRLFGCFIKCGAKSHWR